MAMEYSEYDSTAITSLLHALATERCYTIIINATLTTHRMFMLASGDTYPLFELHKTVRSHAILWERLVLVDSENYNALDRRPDHKQESQCIHRGD